MNAQKAQEALENYFSAKNKFETEVYKSFETIEEFIDQSNAKPKTLEELGWEVNVIAADDISYTKEIWEIEIGKIEINIEITPTHCSVTTFDEEIDVLSTVLPYEEILAIAEKMKELGMTNE